MNFVRCLKCGLAWDMDMGVHLCSQNVFQPPSDPQLEQRIAQLEARVAILEFNAAQQLLQKCAPTAPPSSNGPEGGQRT